MTAVYVVDACRTPMGRIKGALAGVRPDHLSALILQGLLARNPGLDPATIDDVYWGAANQAGEDNRNVARMGVLLAGLPVEVPGATVNRLCGSGMEALASAARAIAAGEADVCLAGGVESMTRAPFVMPRTTEAYPRAVGFVDTRLGWRMVSPWMASLYPPISLGETAENVADRYGVSRERQDAFALRSHRNAAAAWEAGRFAGEVVPVAVPEGTLTIDESVRGDLTADQLAAKKPAFRAGGTVTAGNSSPLNDGAAALLLMSEAALAASGATPLARYVGTAAAGVHPDYMGIGPVPAMRKVLARAGWAVEDLDLVEANEAFAAQAVAAVDELKLDPERVNVNGGAIALGHPLGCSGARIVTTLLHEMRRRGARRGAATMCIGVGQGIASLLGRGVTVGGYSAVIGGGTMGLGIAYVLAHAGDDVILVEPDPTRAADALPTLGIVAESAVNKNKLTRTQAKDLLQRVTTVSQVRDLPAEGARLVVEAVPERMDLKQAILQAVEKHAAPALLATNTSGLSIADLARTLAHPERFLGLHFFNPVWVMALVEIVRGPATSAEALADARALVARIGKEPIVVNDAPGFATSRLGVAIGLEAMRMLEDGVATAADIDKAMELGYRHPMGPLRLTDLVGLDVRLDIARHLERSLGPRFSPPQVLLDKVAAGQLGKKTGQGFYSWP